MFVNTMDLRLVCFDRSRLTPLFLANSSLRRGVWRGYTSVRWPENQANRRFYALKPSYGCIRRYQSSPSWKRTRNLFMGVDAVNFCAGGGWILCPSIGLIGADGVDLETLVMNLLVVSPTCSYVYGEITNCLVVQRIGRYLLSSWHTWRTGSNRRLVDFQTWNWYYSSHTCKLVNTPMQLPPYIMCLWPFGEFHWVAARSGREFVDCIQFLWGLHRIAWGRPCRGRMMIDRHEDTIKSILFALVPLFVCIKSYFYIDDSCLFTLWSLVAITIYSSYNRVTAVTTLLSEIRNV